MIRVSKFPRYDNLACRRLHVCLDLGLAQIYPVWDEDDGDERIAVSASFADPYLLILRDDSSVLLLHSEESGDLDEISVPETVSSLSWLCGCLYTDKHHFFHEDNPKDTTYMFLLNRECRLFVSHKPPAINSFTQQIANLGHLDVPFTYYGTCVCD